MDGLLSLKVLETVYPSSMHRLLFVLVISGLPLKTSWACNRIPQGTIAAKSPVDENYGIAIVGSPQTYVPGQKYNGMLECLSSHDKRNLLSVN